MHIFVSDFKHRGSVAFLLLSLFAIWRIQASKVSRISASVLLSNVALGSMSSGASSSRISAPITLSYGSPGLPPPSPSLIS
jgi:hypothetical protein